VTQETEPHFKKKWINASEITQGENSCTSSLSSAPNERGLGGTTSPWEDHLSPPKSRCQL